MRDNNKIGAGLINGNLFILLPALLVGCAGPTKQHYEIHREQIEADTAVKLAIIEGYYRKKEADKVMREQDAAEFFSGDKDVSDIELNRTLPLPEGDGHQGDIPCPVKCLDNCDEQCRTECPGYWLDLCTNYYDPVESEPPFGTGSSHEAESREQLEQSQEEKLKPAGDTHAYASTPGDNNIQNNTVGNGNRILIQGGSASNSIAGNPIEAAMARLLLREIDPIKTEGEIVGEQFRAGVKTVVGETAVLAPYAAAAYLGGKAIGAMEKGYEAAGGNTSVGGDMSGVSTAEHGDSVAVPDQSTITTILNGGENEQ